ncbi:MAG: PQQ-binding-like beta-propeller repeat protein [Candidatus Thorarchaeota archaeon]|nr:PQQ-binding-like beta-propeller repeat protein [Candidatus Thorarchaeota archaeon]
MGKLDKDCEKVQREFAAWETFGLHGLDYWVDRIVSAENVTYHDPVNSTLVVEEPIDYEWNEGLGIFLPDASVYPYNTGMAQASDGNYSLFDASGGLDNVSAIVDWGHDEEGTGGANPEADIIMTFEDPLTISVLDELNFSVGQSSGDFEQISADRMSINIYNSRQLLIDVDDAMSEREWNWFKYAKIVVYNGGNYSINSLELVQVYNLLTDVLSVTIGPFDFEGNNYWTGDTELDKIVAGTSVGEFICIGYDSGDYEVLWESYDDDRYKLDAYVWDIEFIDTMPNVANYVKMFDLDMEPGLLGYNSWSYGVPAPLIPDPDFLGAYPGGDGEPVYFVGTDGYSTISFDMNGEYSTLPYGIINSDIIKPYTAAEMAWLWPEWGLYPTIISTTYNPNAPYVAESLPHGRATMDFYSRYGPTDPYLRMGSIQEHDATGQITQLLYSSKTTPRLSFKDYDADGDLDMIISNGYVYMCRNMAEEEGEPAFMLEPSYLADINEQTGSIVWGQPEWFDIDADGDLDLILSYATKYGCTVFLNKGTNLDPIWVEDKLLLKNANPMTAMTTLELKDVRMIPNTGGSTLQKYAEASDFELQGDYHMGVYDPAAKQLTLAMAAYDSMESYLVATYPTVSRMEFCIKYSESFKNLGFHIHESWNTDFDLNDWTLSISSGDLDGDGRGEIIVGDYDNNVYAFEHLTNNTYKRMFRSFDLNHTVVSDESPYAYEELEGISGEFTRHIFDHATHLMTGTDLDQDGFLELIVVSDLQVYFFEATGIDDTLSLAYTFDLRDLGYMDVEFDIWEDLEQITALDAGSDLDSDGRKELVLAAGGFIFIYNAEVGSFDGMESTDFFSSSSDKSGRYYLIGNPKAAGSLEHASINTLVTGDTDQDGHPELIVGGLVDSRLLKSDGFAFVYECRGGTFYKAWNTSEDRFYWNPVSNIVIDDQDYDGLDEIIIGHSYGVDIYEWLPGTDSQYQLVESITSSPNYPAIASNSVINQQFETFTVSNRSVSDLTWTVDGSLAVYVYSDGGVLKYRGYNPDYDDFDHPIPFGAQIYTGAEYGGGSSIDYEMEPSIIGTPEGYYMSWRTRRLDGQYDLWVSLYNISKSVPDWEDPIAFYPDAISQIECPKVFEYNSTHIGIMYTLRFIAGQDQLRYHLLNKTLTGGWSSWSTSHIVDFPRYLDYDVHSGSIVKLDDGQFAIAFSARDTAYGKSDYYIWTVIANESMYVADQIIHQATTSFYDETYPDIEYLRSDNKTLLVAYEVRGVAFDERIGIVSSSDNGTSWSIQQDLNPYPNYLSRIDYPGGYFQYYNDTNRMFRPEAYSPTVLGLYDGGFVYTAAFTSVDNSVTDIHDIVYGIVRETDWAYNHLGGVDQMATGDTDSDGRQEIIVSFGNQFAVYEIKESTDGTGLMTYEEVYLSGKFVTDITGITVYDSNMNGWQEIAISCRYGDVFVMEYSDPSHGATPFGFSEQISEIVTYGMGMPACLKTFDFDNDGRDEVLLAPVAGGFHLIDDDGTIIWNVTMGSMLADSEIADLDGDGVQEFICKDMNDNIVVFDLSDGSLFWNYSLLTGNYTRGFDIGDLDGDNTLEIVVGTSDGKIWIFNHTGDLWHVEDVGSDVKDVAIGDYTNDTIMGVAYGNSTFAVRVINPLTGTLLYETPNDMVQSTGDPIIAHDFNGDGYDDVIFGRKFVRIADVITGTLIYNSTVESWTRSLIVQDFDGDGTDELFVATQDGGMYLVESVTLRNQWYYQSDLGDCYYVEVGSLGGTGTYDILMAMNNSLVIALDGKSGLPMWMNITGSWLQGIATADFDGDGEDNALAWFWPYGTYYSYLKEFKAIGLPTPIWEVVFPAHPAYWQVDTGYSAFQDVWTCDVDGDNWAEVFVKSNDKYLSMWSSHYGTMTWNITLGGGTIQDVFFGDLDGVGSLDVAVIVDGDEVRLFEAETTNKLGKIYAPSLYRIPDLAIADFRAGPGYEYDEVAVLYESTLNVRSYVSWYEGDGTLMYTNSVDSNNGVAHMAIGLFTGATTYDVAMGSKEGTVRFFSGDDGVLDWSYAIGFYIEDIVFGDFTGYSRNQGVAVEYNDHVVLLDTFTQSPMVLLNFTFGYLRDYYCADLNGDSYDEVIAYIRSDGIRTYNTTGDEVWTFEAPLRYTLNDPFTDVLVEDINDDGYPDVVLVNYEYVDIIDGSTGNLQWHYISEGRVLGVAASIRPHKFDTRYNLAVVDISSLSIASYYESAPALPPPPLLAEALGFDSIEIVTVATVTILPLLAVLVVMTRRIRKKE